MERSSQVKKSEENPFEILYFGSPNKTVNFAFVEGKKMPYERNLFVNAMDNQSISLSLMYKYPLRHLGPEYENFYNVALPCNDLIYKKTDAELEKCDHTKENILEKCMIKIKNDLSGDYVGYKSGCRSAIIKFNNKYYRLKGCGNLDKGFNTRFMGFPKGAVDVRGCQFRHTAYREIYMSDVINETLNKFGYEVNNKPVGLWLYGEVESIEKGILNEKKRIDKFCTIYEVVSEKRLGCQLIPGLEIIVFEYLKEFLKSNNEEFNKNYKEIVADLFSDSKNRVIRLENSSEIKEIEPTVNFVPVVELNREQGDTIISLFEKYKIYSEKEENLINIFKLIYEKSSINPILEYFENSEIFRNILVDYFEKNSIYTMFTESVNSNSKNIINDKITKVKEALDNKIFKLLEIISIIFARVGWESGRLKRIMQDNNINWGTYEDQPYRLHCNAHTDNYTIYPRGTSLDKNLLCILDFDMAFLKENFINISNEHDSKTYGYPDNFLFDSYLNMERQHLEWEFAGLENIISFDFYKEDMKNEKLDFILKAFFYLLRDISVLHFRQGYLFNEFSLNERYDELYENIYDLIDLALLVSHDFMDK